MFQYYLNNSLTYFVLNYKFSKLFDKTFIAYNLSIKVVCLVYLKNKLNIYIICFIQKVLDYVVDFAELKNIHVFEIYDVNKLIGFINV